MKKFNVCVSLECYYVIEAEDEDSACDKAWDYFSECEPSFDVSEADEED